MNVDNPAACRQMYTMQSEINILPRETLSSVGEQDTQEPIFPIR